MTRHQKKRNESESCTVKMPSEHAENPPKYVNPFSSHKDGSVSRPLWLLVGGESCTRFLTDGAASLYEKMSGNKMFRRGSNILTSFGVSAERVTLARKSVFSRLRTPVQFIKER